MWTFHSPLALAGMENQVLVVLGTDGELMLRWVEDVEQQVTMAGAVDTYSHNENAVKPKHVCSHR